MLKFELKNKPTVIYMETMKNREPWLKLKLFVVS